MLLLCNKTKQFVHLCVCGLRGVDWGVEGVARGSFTTTVLLELIENRVSELSVPGFYPPQSHVTQNSTCNRFDVSTGSQVKGPEFKVVSVVLVYWLVYCP